MLFVLVMSEFNFKKVMSFIEIELNFYYGIVDLVYC